MNNIIDKAISYFNSKFGPVFLTALTVFLLFTSYKRSENTFIIYIFFLVVILISVVIMITFLSKPGNKKEYSPIFNKAFLTLLVSIVTLLLIKTMFTFNLFPIIAITLSVFLFYSSLHTVLKYFNSK